MQSNPFDSVFFGLVRSFLSMGPLLLVLIGGIVLTVVWRKRHPQAALLALSGLVVMLLGSIGGHLLSFLLIQQINQGNASNPMNVHLVLTAVGMMSSFAHACGIALLVAAAFAGRRSGEELGADSLEQRA